MDRPETGSIVNNKHHWTPSDYCPWTVVSPPPHPAQKHRRNNSNKISFKSLMLCVTRVFWNFILCVSART